MSNKPYNIRLTSDRDLMKQVRGNIPLRGKQVHRQATDFRRKPKHFKGWDA
jgi:hypothetical protein